jgi:hypothetical protein
MAGTAMDRSPADQVHAERLRTRGVSTPKVLLLDCLADGGGGLLSPTGHSRFAGGTGHGAMVIPDLLAGVAASAASLSAAAGGLLAARRLGGGIAAAPGPEAVLAVCGAGLVLVAIADMSARAGGSSLPAILARIGLVLGVGAVAFPVPIAAPGPTVVAIAAVLVTGVAVLTGPAGRRLLRLRNRHTAGRAARAETGGDSAVTAVAPRFPMVTGGTVNGGSMAGSMVVENGVDGTSPAIAGAAALPATNVMQRFERRTLADGRERVDGMIRVAVPRGSRLGWAHVGFCPPFGTSPAVDVATGYDGVEATVTAAEVLPWGVRIEVRLDEPAEETLDIPVDVLARTAA